MKRSIPLLSLLLIFVSSCTQSQVSQQPNGTDDDTHGAQEDSDTGDTPQEVKECVYWPQSANEEECEMSANRWYQLNFSEPIVGIVDSTDISFIATPSELYAYGYGQTSHIIEPRPQGTIMAFDQPNGSYHNMFFALIDGNVYVMTEDFRNPWIKTNGALADGSIRGMWMDSIGSAFPVVATSDDHIATFDYPDSWSYWMSDQYSKQVIPDVTIATYETKFAGTKGKLYHQGTDISFNILGKAITGFVRGNYDKYYENTGETVTISRYLVGTDSGLFFRDDYIGGDWKAVDGPLSTASIDQVSNTITMTWNYFVLSNGVLYVSTDLGKTWSALTTGQEEDVSFSKFFVPCHIATAKGGFDCLPATERIVSTTADGENYIMCYRGISSEDSLQ